MSRWIITAILLVALIATGIWGYNQYLENQEYKIRTDNLYQKSFYELVGHIGNIETRLSKIMVSGDRGQSLEMLSDVWRQSDAAGISLGQLPLGHLSLNKTSKFLNQLSDYCYYLTRKTGDGRTLSLDEIENLRELHKSCVQLHNELMQLQNELNTKAISWVEIQKKGNQKLREASEDIVTEQFTNIEQNTIEYPTLIYDGPFSETLLQKEKVELPGEMIDQNKAMEIAAEFIGKDRVKNATPGPEGKGNIPVWGVYLETNDENDGSLYVTVSKKGGKVISVVSQGGPQQAKLTLKQAKERARKFLEEKGYPNMIPTYEQQYDGMAVINFAYEQDGVIIYPDLIKVKISLEDGDIFGFEAMNYVVAHKDRKLEEPSLSMEEARRLVSPNLKVNSERLALIPGDGGGEILCYEFKGEYGGDTFIVYINAKTGKEENILKIINTDNGSLVL